MPAAITGGTYTGGTGMPTRLGDLAVDNSNSIDSTTGRIIVELAAAAAAGLLGAVRIQDGFTATVAQVLGPSDSLGQPPGLIVGSQGYLWDSGVASSRLARNASAANLVLQSGLGAALTAPPGQWQASSIPASGTQASASRAAGGVGVRHTVARALFTAGASVAPAAGATTGLNIRDGASGAGAAFDTAAITIPAAVVPTIVIPFAQLNEPGSAATAMTAEFFAGMTGVQQTANIGGFDAS